MDVEVRDVAPGLCSWRPGGKPVHTRADFEAAPAREFWGEVEGG
jgi:hypothetical protein